MKSPGGFWGFAARLLGNKHQNLFIVELGVALTLAKFGLVGFPGRVAGKLIRGFIGILIEDGIFHIDVALDAYREGKKMEEFKGRAGIAYDNAMKGTKTEAEKDEIRKQYLEIVGRISAVGKPKSPK